MVSALAAGAKTPRHVRAAIAVAVVGIVVTALATWLVERERDTNVQRQFDRLADDARAAIEGRVEGSTELLFGLRALFAQGDVTRTAFHRFVASVDIDRLPGLQAVSFNRRIAVGEVAAYEGAVRSDTSLTPAGYPNFEVYPRLPETSEHVVAEYVEPLPGNEAALGFDVASDPTRRAAVEAARDSGDAVATRGVDLVQLRGQTSGGRGVLVVLPIYDPARDPRTDPERRRAFVGVVVVALHLDELLRDVLGARPLVEFEIYDVGPTVAGPRAVIRSRDLLFDRDRHHAALDPSTAETPNRFIDIDVGGRRWRIFAEARGSLPGAPSGIPTLTAAAAGAVATMLGALMVHASGASRARRRRELFEGYLAFTPDAVVVVDRDGVITHANERLGEMFGRRSDDLVGTAVETLLPERFGPTHRGHREEYAGDPGIRPMGRGLALFGLRSDGTEFPVEVGLSPLHTEDGTVFAAAVRDVTERKNAEAALREALDREQEAANQLREVDALKDEFLDITAHELRTPLTSILGFTELLVRRRGAMDEERVADMLGRIEGNATEMREMLGRLLDVSRLRAGRVDLRPEAVDLAAVLGEIVSRPRSEAADHTLTLEVDEGIRVDVDTGALDRVVSNLLSNAVKFSPPDTTVTVSGRPRDSEVVVSVADQGPGIDPDEVPQLFERFFQGRTQVPGVRGVGVGLSIVKRYVDLWGGRVWVDSPAGAGATFSFTVPAVTGPDDGATSASDG